MITVNSIQALVVSVLSAIRTPLTTLGTGMLLLLVGWVISRALQNGITYLLKRIGLDRLSHQTGFHHVLTRGGVRRSVSDLIGDLAYWGGVFVTVLVVAAVTGLMTPDSLLGLMVPYISSVLTAVFILGTAIYLAAVVSAIVKVVANNVGISYGEVLARIASYAVIFSAFLAAMVRLGVNPEWITTSMAYVVAGFALAFAISFGLGTKDAAGRFMTGIFSKRK